MTAVSELFERPKKRLAWGREALDQFHAKSRKHLDNWPHKIVIEPDDDPALEVQKIVLKPLTIPEEIEILANRAIEDVKHAFDQATFAACKALQRDLRPNDTINFPWTDTEAGFRSRVAKKSCRIPDHLHDVFLRLKPYGAGEDLTLDDQIARQMAHIANRKHSIGLVVRTQLHYRIKEGRWAGGDRWLDTATESLEFILAPQLDPVKNEIVLARGTPGVLAYTQYDAEFSLHIAIDEPSPAGDYALEWLLHVFAEKANAVIETLENAVS